VVASFKNSFSNHNLSVKCRSVHVVEGIMNGLLTYNNKGDIEFYLSLG
jgi:hypothetical protein